MQIKSDQRFFLCIVSSILLVLLYIYLNKSEVHLAQVGTSWHKLAQVCGMGSTGMRRWQRRVQASIYIYILIFHWSPKSKGSAETSASSVLGCPRSPLKPRGSWCGAGGGGLAVERFEPTSVSSTSAASKGGELQEAPNGSQEAPNAHQETPNEPK